MDLSIIIVNYKNKVKITKCLAALYESDLSNLNFEVFVVDNNSGDDLSSLAFYPNLTIVNSDKNLGMGGGNNLGLEKSSGEFVLILNPDAYVSHDAIKILWQYIKDNNDVAVVGPKLLNSDGSLQNSCAQFPRVYMPILRRTFLGDYFKKIRDNFMMTDFNHDEIASVDWLMGSCLMIRRDIWSGFDERFFMYFEDVDVCRTFRAMGKKVVYNPSAIVVHDHERASAKYPWYQAIFRDALAREHIKSWVKYFWKWRTKKII
ncbi:MAG: glycosyltransferase [Candidatus Falkowbacteria bacterium]